VKKKKSIYDYEIEDFIVLIKRELTALRKLYREYLALREALWKLCESINSSECFDKYHEQYLNSKITSVWVEFEMFYEFLRDRAKEILNEEVEKVKQLIVTAHLIYR
jgi:hypothetical protein